MLTDLPTEQPPFLCREIRRECTSCMNQTASSTAAVCPSLNGSRLREIFLMLYPHPNCRKMEQFFGEAYLEYAVR